MGPNGEQVGIVRIEDALRLAQEADLDLVEVAPNARPPVAKLMDYGKYKYESAQKARESRRNQQLTVIMNRSCASRSTRTITRRRRACVRFLEAGTVKVRTCPRREQSGRSRPDCCSAPRTWPNWASSNRSRSRTVATWSWFLRHTRTPRRSRRRRRAQTAAGRDVLPPGVRAAGGRRGRYHRSIATMQQHTGDRCAVV